MFFRLVLLRPSRTRKIHGLNGLVYYFLYLYHPLCEGPAKKSTSFHPLASFLRSFVRTLLVFFSPLSFSPFLSFFSFSSLFPLRLISIEKCVSQIEVFYKCAAWSSVVYSQFLSRTINRKLAHAVVKRQNVRLFKDFLRGNKNWTGEREGEDEKSLETGRRQARYTRKSEEAREREKERVTGERTIFRTA